MALFQFNWGNKTDLTLAQYNNNSYYIPLVYPEFKISESNRQKGYTVEKLFQAYLLEAIQYVNIFTRYQIEKQYITWEEIDKDIQGQREYLIKIIYTIIDYWLENGGVVERGIDFTYQSSQNSSLSVSNIPYATWKEIIGTKATNMLMGSKWVQQTYVSKCYHYSKPEYKDLQEQIDELKATDVNLQNQINNINNNLSNLDKKVNNLDIKLNEFNKRITNLENIKIGEAGNNNLKDIKIFGTEDITKGALISVDEINNEKRILFATGSSADLEKRISKLENITFIGNGPHGLVSVKLKDTQEWNWLQQEIYFQVEEELIFIGIDTEYGQHFLAIDQIFNEMEESPYISIQDIEPNEMRDDEMKWELVKEQKSGTNLAYFGNFEKGRKYRIWITTENNNSLLIPIEFEWQEKSGFVNFPTGNVATYREVRVFIDENSIRMIQTGRKIIDDYGHIIKLEREVK